MGAEDGVKISDLVEVDNIKDVEGRLRLRNKREVDSEPEVKQG